jgi:ABC-type polysaccharide/polyol phosphate transport system ATPase subunit
MTSLIKADVFPSSPGEEAADAVIRLDDVSVRYRVPLGTRVTLKEAIVRWRWRSYMEHLALDNVSLTIGRGETVGVIGSNGAGKSTLLKVIARVLHPTAGRLRIRGRVTSILDLVGAFDLELTGRENVYLNATLGGMSYAEIGERFDEIAAFADIGEFLEAPLRTYSAGMIIRLAFAVASSINGDILLIDEALGVGDAAFQRKCAARLEEHKRRGVTFVLVSHDVARLREWCSRIVWLDHGRVVAAGDPGDVIDRYLAAGSS